MTMLRLTYGAFSFLIFDFTADCMVSCEHYVPGISRDHFHDSSVCNGAYDLDYIKASITGDLEEVARIEHNARDLGYGPLVECSTVSNVSAQKAFCRESLCSLGKHTK